MALPILARKRVLAAKVEATPGTAVTLAAADAGFRCIDRKLEVKQETVPRQQQGSLGVASNVPAALSTELTFKTHMHGKGAAGVPAWGLFLQCCGLGLTTQTYAATSDTSLWKTMSAGAFIDGRRVMGRGMMGTAKITLESGMPGVIDWSMKGAWIQDPDDSAILTGMTYESAVPPIFAGTGSLTLGGATTYTKVQKVEIDLGGDVQLREDPNATGGYLMAFIADRVTKIKMDPEATAFATKNFWNDARLGTTIAFSAVLGTVANNIMTIAASTLQPASAPAEGDRGGKLTDEVEFTCNTDDLSIVFS